MQLGGVNRFGAMGSMWGASATGFSLSGVFRDFADFLVLELWNADDYFGHYSTTKYLPDFDFTGMVLTYDWSATGVQQMDSVAYQWIPWRSLSYITPTGSSGTIDLQPHATKISGTLTAASAAITVSTPGAVIYDRCTIWYQNLAFDFIASGGESASTIAANLAAQINGYAWGTSGISLPLSASAVGGVITVTCAVAGQDGNSITLYTQCKNSNLTLSPGAVGASTAVPLTGGVSAATWRVTIDFSALGITQLRRLWLTISPQLIGGVAYSDTNWVVTVTSWSVSDPSSHRPLKIAGPGSVRIGSRDSWVTYSGSSWVEEASNQPGGTGWYWGGYAHRMSNPGDSVTVKYSCQSSHNLYLGTSLYSDRGIVSISIDGGAPISLDCFLLSVPTGPVVTRRQVGTTAIAAGSHTVTITLSSSNHVALGSWDSNSTGRYFYFDFLEAAVPGDIQNPATTYANVAPAVDWDTDHGYKLPPQRTAWMLQKMGFGGQIDHYMGVFWWNQRHRVGGTFPVATVTFGGTWASGDGAFLDISGLTIGKSVFPADVAAGASASIAAHFAYFINSTFDGAYASAAGAVLTITNRTPEFSFTFSVPAPASSAGTVSSTGSLSGGTEGSWEINAGVTPVLNQAAHDWHADYFATLQAAGLSACVAFSMELVNPPSSGGTWAQAYASGSPVLTATGFGGLNSTQCTFNSTVQAYQKEAYLEIAALMNTAGMPIWLQFGEFLWWFFPGTSPTDTQGMAYYDASTAAAASTALGRALATFSHPTDSPAVNSYADANFLRGLIYAHCSAISAFVKATYSSAKFEVLWPYDVNYPTQTAIAQLGGQLNRYVNLPSQWQAQSGSGLDRFKTEGLAFGATERNLDEASQTIAFPEASPLSWAQSATAYLMPLFNGGCPWKSEYLRTVNAGAPLIILWAFDHFCLLGWPLPLPVNQARVSMARYRRRKGLGK